MPVFKKVFSVLQVNLSVASSSNKYDHSSVIVVSACLTMTLISCLNVMVWNHSAGSDNSCTASRWLIVAAFSRNSRVSAA